MSTNTENRRILIIDDERPILLTLEALLARYGYQPETAGTAAHGLRLFKNNPPAVVLLDLELPDAAGLETLEQIKQEHPDTQVIILTAHDSLNNAIESIKRGAYHFIAKPYAPEELLSLVEKALEKQSLLRETEQLRERTQQLEKRLEMAETRLAPVFKSKVMQEIHELITAMAPSEANVLITGESGVGKEVIANVIHSRSRRAAKPMVKLNCAAFPPTLIESELFGYVKGAFTGAMGDFSGMIAEASGSTLFLDEISEMPPELQTRFLRVLQEREYRPLGSTRTLKADFRVIAATNRPIAQALSDGRLRPDLYYRINTFQIEVPPLRERKEDIPPLVATFVKQFSQQLGKPEPEITPEAFQKLLDFTWRGNVRELQNAMEYAVVLARQGRIGVKELPAEVQMPSALHDAAHVAATNNG
ncbi:MAG TPA: sigma-54 dependent transcriptional regulator, partial [Chthoniobacterales bacterium]|nr:sigma-54 dependent transcriptional regulator [Chthoniobacterales bacterium]